MATRFIEGFGASAGDAATELTRLKGDTVGVGPVLYDAVDGIFKYYDRVNSVVRQLAALNPQPVTITGAIALTAALHVGRPLFLDAVAGGQIDLPAATGSGNTYRANVITALTSAAWVFRTSASAGDRFAGAVFIDDSGDTAALAAAACFPAGASDEVLTMAFSATLGTIGAYVEFIDIKTGVWQVRGFLGSSLDPATPWGVATT
jgi:hypothetical protein